MLLLVGIGGIVALLAILASKQSGAKKDGPKGGTNDLGPEGRKLAKMQILNLLEEGHIPDGVTLEGAEVLLEAGEKPIWGFGNVRREIVKTSTRTQFVGGSHGMSFRLAKGVSYRLGSFRGSPIRREHVSREEESGILVIGSRNVYFRSGENVIKIPIRKMLSVRSTGDGIEITREGKKAPTETFKSLDDPSFAVDAITRLHAERIPDGARSEPQQTVSVRLSFAGQKFERATRANPWGTLLRQLTGG